MHDVLANPIWHAALTRQRHFALGDGSARRFHPLVVPLAALENSSRDAAEALLPLVAPGERVWFFAVESGMVNPPLIPPAWRESRRIPGFQMLCEAPPQLAELSEQPNSVRLDPVADLADMEALKAVAFPGFFGPRTPEMGRYRGIRVDGELVAMAGERLNLESQNGQGYREVSAVCTHPAHVGRGYAQQLTREATIAISRDGDLPFLHVAAGNDRAIAVYERLGFRRNAAVVFIEFARWLEASDRSMSPL